MVSESFALFCFRKLVYADLEAVAPLEVDKMPYALQSITISVSMYIYIYS